MDTTKNIAWLMSFTLGSDSGGGGGEGGEDDKKEDNEAAAEESKENGNAADDSNKGEESKSHLRSQINSSILRVSLSIHVMSTLPKSPKSDSWGCNATLTGNDILETKSATKKFHNSTEFLLL